MRKDLTMIKLAAEMARGEGLASDDPDDYTGPAWYRNKMAFEAAAARECAKLWALDLRDLIDKQRKEQEFPELMEGYDHGHV
jgi:hypothetical protein